jgi:hypothetical protein
MQSVEFVPTSSSVTGITDDPPSHTLAPHISNIASGYTSLLAISCSEDEQASPWHAYMTGFVTMYSARQTAKEPF